MTGCPDPNRRDLCQALAALAFLGWGGPPAAPAADPLRTVSLGRTGLRTTLLGMGTGYQGYGRSSAIVRAGTAEGLIRQAYERGLRYFDLADAYGTHPAARAALRAVDRTSLTLATKIWTGPDPGIPERERPPAGVAVDRFRRELGTDYLDLVQIHCVRTGDWPVREARVMEELETLKARGVIRAHGVSVHGLEALEAAAGSPWVDVVHARLNPFGVAMDHRDPARVLPLLQRLHAAGCGVIAMKLVGNGRFRAAPSRLDASLRFALGLDAVDLLLVGFESAGQIDDLLGRLRAAQERAAQEGATQERTTQERTVERGPEGGVRA